VPNSARSHGLRELCHFLVFFNKSVLKFPCITPRLRGLPPGHQYLHNTTIGDCLKSFCLYVALIWRLFGQKNQLLLEKVSYTEYLREQILWNSKVTSIRNRRLQVAFNLITPFRFLYNKFSLLLEKVSYTVVSEQIIWKLKVTSIRNRQLNLFLIWDLRGLNTTTSTRGNKKMVTKFSLS